MNRTRKTRSRLPTLAALVFALTLSLSAPRPARAAGDFERPTDQESGYLTTLLGRLNASTNTPNLPLPVQNTIQSLTRPVTRTFTGAKGATYGRVRIRVRTWYAHWQPERMEGGASAGDPQAATVGWYAWRWETESIRTDKGRELNVTADNVLMLDPSYIASNEDDPLGRFIDEALLYHELLHGQLMINAMDDPAWRTKVCRTGRVDTSRSDGNHILIHPLERSYLSHRGGRFAFTIHAAPSGSASPAAVAAPSESDAATPGTTDEAAEKTVSAERPGGIQANASGGGAFAIPAGFIPRGMVGAVNVRFRTTTDANVQNLRLTLGRRSGRRQVLLTGSLVNPHKDGFFLAEVTFGDAS